MIQQELLITKLQRRFNGLNNDEISAAINDGLHSLGYLGIEFVPSVDYDLVLSYVSYTIATDLAVNAASYFSYTDGTESVDKTAIMENYTKLAATFKTQYEAELAKREREGSTPLPIFYIMKRADR